MSRPGRLIAIEGIDGAGKSTLAANLYRRLGDAGFQARLVQRYWNSSLTALWRRALERDAVTQRDAALLAAADSAFGQEGILNPALRAGEVVVADRYVYSHIVHFAARGVTRPHLEVWFSGFAAPDVILYLDAPPEIARDRLAAKGKPDFWECGLDNAIGMSIGQAWREFQRQQPQPSELHGQLERYQQKLADLYAQILPDRLTQRLDAGLPPDELSECAWQALGPLLEQNV